MVADRRLPWLQDVPEQAVWVAWGAAVDDVRIVDPQGRLLGVYNVAAHDLSFADNQTALRRLLEEAARIVDSDHDQLPDDWEVLSFGGLGAQPNEDPDRDGQDNLAEFAAGTSPTVASLPAALRANLLPDAPDGHILEVQFTRLSAIWLDYALETSSDLREWRAVNPPAVQWQPLRVFYDGSGTSRATARFAEPSDARPALFVRWRAGLAP